MPRPRTLPVETYQPVVSGSRRAMGFMPKHGVKGIIGGGAATGRASDQVVRQWRRHLAKHRRDSGGGREHQAGADTGRPPGHRETCPV